MNTETKENEKVEQNNSELNSDTFFNLNFEDLFNIQDLQIIQDEFAKATGLASIITRPDGTPLTKPSNFSRLCGDIIRKSKQGLTDCIHSDSTLGKSNPEIHKCLACGLWDAGVRISVENQHLATWLIGQIRDERQTEKQIRNYAAFIGVDEDTAVEAFNEIPVMPVEKFNDCVELLYSFSKNLSDIAYQNLKQNHLINSLERTKHELSENEDEINSIFRAAPAGIGVVSNRILTKINKRLCEMLGYSQDELLNKSARFLYPNEEEYTFVGEEKYRQIREKGTGSVETKFLCKDGRIIDVILSSTPLDLKDYSKGVTFTALDITYLKNKEKELKESESKYRTIMETMDDPVYICSSDYSVEFMNPAMEKLIGSSAIGKQCYSTIFGRNSKCPWCVYDKISNRKATNFEITNPKDNEKYHISSSLITHVNDDTSMLSIFRNITELKKLQSNLQQSQKMEAIGTLAGGIAHDFNNILSPIVGYVELTRSILSAESPGNSYLSKVLKATDRAQELVKQILAFSKGSEYEVIPVSPQKIVSEVLKLLRATLPSTIEIKHKFETENSLILAAPTQIHQIFMNLCTNAFHAMEQTGGVLSISICEMDIPLEKSRDLEILPGKYLRITVSDTGYGIDPENMKKIFDPYFTTKTKEKGTGLGLAITHGLVRDYSGAIEVSSTPGSGSVFKIYFPLIQTDDVNLSEKKELSLIGGNERVLLIDDDFEIASMQKEMLEFLGYHVEIQTNSSQAWDYFKSNSNDFDLVITDYTMPHMTGIELIRQIYTIRSDIRIILCTGFSEGITDKVVEDLGIDALLMKPVSIRTFSHEIRRIMDT